MGLEFHPALLNPSLYEVPELYEVGVPFHRRVACCRVCVHARVFCDARVWKQTNTIRFVFVVLSAFWDIKPLCSATHFFKCDTNKSHCASKAIFLPSPHPSLPIGKNKIEVSLRRVVP